ncbi:MAG: DUF4142 domain-containing protein [Geminicoccaceae bacterium]|nr:DUF4142 domain-containing protein [Geminicoccaceae bacterium]
MTDTRATDRPPPWRLGGAVLVALALLLAPAARAAMDAQAFVDVAARDGMLLVEMSQQALDRTPGDEVAALATAVIADHRTNAIILGGIAERKGFDLPTDLDEAQSKALAEMGGAPIDGFAPLYVRLQVEAHQKAIHDMQRYVAEGDDADLKSFAEDTLRTLKGGLRDAEALEKKLAG